MWHKAMQAREQRAYVVFAVKSCIKPWKDWPRRRIGEGGDAVGEEGGQKKEEGEDEDEEETTKNEDEERGSEEAAERRGEGGERTWMRIVGAGGDRGFGSRGCSAERVVKCSRVARTPCQCPSRSNESRRNRQRPFGKQLRPVALVAPSSGSGCR